MVVKVLIWINQLMLFFLLQYLRPRDLGNQVQAFYFIFKVFHVMVPPNASDFIILQHLLSLFYSLHCWSLTFLDRAEMFNPPWLCTYPRITLILELPRYPSAYTKNLFIQELTWMLTPCKAFSEPTIYKHFLFLQCGRFRYLFSHLFYFIFSYTKFQTHIC